MHAVTGHEGVELLESREVKNLRAGRQHHRDRGHVAAVRLLRPAGRADPAARHHRPHRRRTAGQAPDQPVRRPVQEQRGDACGEPEPRRRCARAVCRIVVEVGQVVTAVIRMRDARAGRLRAARHPRPGQRLGRRARGVRRRDRQPLRRRGPRAAHLCVQRHRRRHRVCPGARGLPGAGRQGLGDLSASWSTARWSAP